MAKFNFDADGTEEAGNYSPVPEGEYVLKCVKADYKKTSTNKHMLNLEFEVDDGSYQGRKVWTNVVFNPKGEAGHGLTVQALKAFGFEADGALSIDTEDWVDRTCWANIVIETYTDKNGDEKQKNAIPTAGFITDSTTTNTVPAQTSTKATRKPAQTSTKKEEVPF